MNVEYAEAVYGKSGQGMAEVLYTSFAQDINEVEYIETLKGRMEQITTHVGLNIAHKVIAVCGDNAPNNDTFCDHFHAKLKVKYDDNPQLLLGLPRCLFRGRQSRIRCLAHILALIAESVFKHLKSGTTKDAQTIINSVLEGNGQFPTECASLSVWMKIRTMVLWIMGSDERRKWWKEVCNEFIPLDVDSRWNSLYLMMMVARRYKAQISLFGRDHPDC
jgi:hypothetical protein